MVNRNRVDFLSPFETHQATGSVSKVIGAHTIKTGAEFRRTKYAIERRIAHSAEFNFTRDYTQGPDPLRASSNGGHGFGTFLLGAGSAATPSILTTANIAPTIAGYFQDDWKATRKLTVNLGVRYDLYVPRTETDDQLSWFDPTPRNPLSDKTGLGLFGGLRFVGRDGLSRRQFQTDRNNFSPRIGFAYLPRERVVIRGGFAQLYPIPETNASGNGGNEGFVASSSWQSAADGLLPVTTWQQAFSEGLNPASRGSEGLLTLVGRSISPYVPASFFSPYALQWNFSVQVDLSGESVVEASYLGNRGVHLPVNTLPLNQLRPEHLALQSSLVRSVPNPFLGVISGGVLSGPTTTVGRLLRSYPHFDSVDNNKPTIGNSSYHALGLRYERRFQRGHVVQASFTAGKLIDDSSQPGGLGGIVTGVQNGYDMRAERALSTNDIARRLVIASVAQLPFGKGQPFLNDMPRALEAILGGWNVSGILTLQGGVPVVITAPNTSGSLGGGQRPNSTGSSAELSGPAQQRLGRWFDTSRFSQPTPFTYGNVTRTLPDVRGPGLVGLDFSLLKNFAVTENWRLQFRTEAFNLTNTPAFGLPGGTLGASTFGVISSQVNAPRQIQFALRLDF
jgi:hypothetical protein